MHSPDTEERDGYAEGGAGRNVEALEQVEGKTGRGGFGKEARDLVAEKNDNRSHRHAEGCC